jgi:hypothetical protein
MSIKTYIASTRFNSETIKENINYMIKNKVKGNLYGANQEISEKIPYGSSVYIVEMNNSTNKIEGIGLIKNRRMTNTKYVIYEGFSTCNLYTYKANFRLDRETISQYNSNLVVVLELILFKGYTHSKRLRGITRITDKLLNDKRCNNMRITEEIRSIFLEHYNK